MPPVHDSAVASVSPRARQRSSTISETERSSSPKRYWPSRVAQRLRDSRAALARRRARRRGRRGSRTRARRSSPPPRRPRRRPSASASATADSGVPKKRSDVVRPRAGARVEHPAHRLGLERPRPQPLELARRPRQDDDDARPRVEDEPGAVPARPERDRALRKRRLLADAGREVARTAGRAARRSRARSPRSRCSSASSTTSGRAGDARDELDRAVVVRRPEPAGDEAEIGLEAAREARARDPRRRSPTITIRAGSRPSRTASAARNGPLRSWRSPRTSSVPVTTMAARGRLKRWPRTIRCAVTTNVVPAGRSTRVAVRARTTTFCGSASASWSAAPVERLPLPLLERPAVEQLAGGGARPDLHPRARRPTARTTRCAVPARRLRRARRSCCVDEAGDLLALRAAELPGGDHERRRDRDRDERDSRDPRLARPPRSRRWRGDAARAERRVVLADREARVVLVDERLAVEAERLGVRAQEAAHVRGCGQDVEALVLERAEVLRPDLRPLLELGEVEVLAERGPRAGWSRCRT